MTPSRETPSQHAARVHAKCLHIVEALRVQKRNLATRRENQARRARLLTTRDDVGQDGAGLPS